MTAWLALWSAAALADDRWPVRAGETVETVAVALGDPRLADEIRRINDLAPSAQPTVGASRHLGNGGVQAAALLSRKYDLATAGRLGCSQNRSQVAGVLHAAEGQA